MFKFKTFHSLIESFDLIQKVHFPTHIHGHTLDLILTKSNNDNISNVLPFSDALSDHFSVTVAYLYDLGKKDTILGKLFYSVLFVLHVIYRLILYFKATLNYELQCYLCEVALNHKLRLLMYGKVNTENEVIYKFTVIH